MEIDMGSEGKKASSENPLERQPEVAEDVFVPAYDVDNCVLLSADDAVPDDDVAPYLIDNNNQQIRQQSQDLKRDNIES